MMEDNVAAFSILYAMSLDDGEWATEDIEYY